MSVSEIRNTFDGINNRLDISEEEEKNQSKYVFISNYICGPKWDIPT